MKPKARKATKRKKKISPVEAMELLINKVESPPRQRKPTISELLKVKKLPRDPKPRAVKPPGELAREVSKNVSIAVEKKIRECLAEDRPLIEAMTKFIEDFALVFGHDWKTTRMYLQKSRASNFLCDADDPFRFTNGMVLIQSYKAARKILATRGAQFYLASEIQEKIDIARLKDENAAEKRYQERMQGKQRDAAMGRMQEIFDENLRADEEHSTNHGTG